jgi:hypothetical protein
MGREECLFLMEGVELNFRYGLFVPDVLEVLSKLLFAFEELVVNDRVDILEVVHFSSIIDMLMV